MLLLHVMFIIIAIRTINTIAIALIALQQLYHHQNFVDYIQIYNKMKMKMKTKSSKMLHTDVIKPDFEVESMQILQTEMEIVL